MEYLSKQWRGRAAGVGDAGKAPLRSTRVLTGVRLPGPDVGDQGRHAKLTEANR